VHSFRATSQNELPRVAEKLLEAAGRDRVFVLQGAMGAGKTTLIKELCAQLGVSDPTSSPTFSLVNEYRSKDGSPVYHFDFYRIKSESEAYDMGFEDYLYSGNYCFIEWPEKIPGLIPQDCVRIEISVEDGVRHISINR
jgi:tRNA threonylcarbamoyladenosine biosynthesis protein TsaE